MEMAAPILLAGGGIFLLFILHWLFWKKNILVFRILKSFSLKTAFGFFASVSILLTVIVWFALKQKSHDGFWRSGWINSVFITHGFKQNAEAQEKI